MQSASETEQPQVRFRFKRLGPVKKAELDLGDLTIIAGRNNTGKTYLAYTLYGFLKMWKGIGAQKTGGPTRTGIENLIRKAVVEGQARCQLKRETLSQERQALIQAVSGEFSAQALADVLNSSEDALDGAAIEVELAGDLPEQHQYEVALRAGGLLSIQFEESEIIATCDKAYGRLLSDLLVSSIGLQFLYPELSLEPFILCAERFGISLFYKELDFTKSRVMDLLQQMGDAKMRDSAFPYLLIDNVTSRYSLPIKENIDYTRNLTYFQRDRSEIFQDKLFDDIKDIMEGFYRSSGDDIQFRSKARKERGFSLPLHRASSSARGLADLYFFLRHVAHKNHLLFIDEPESHLDTANQIQFARLLARLVRAGVKVLITTHSDYLIKEINNLIMLSKSFENKSKIVKKLKYKKDDFLPPESVRAYVAEDNTLTPCTIDEFGIDMPVFDKTINEINRASNELASRLMIEDEDN